MQLSNVEALELTFQFEAIFEAFPDILFKISRDGKIHYCKSGRSALKNLQPEQYVGQNIKDIFPSLYIDAFEDAVAKLTTIGDVVCLEFPFERDNKTYWFEARIVPFYKKQLLAILRDITERKELAVKLQNEQTKATEGAEMIKAVTEALALPKNTENIAPNTDLDTLREKIAEYNMLSEKLNYEINLRRGIESTLKIHVEQLQKRNKELEHFRYLASNDFQEPLRHISSFAKILSDKYNGKLDEEAYEMLDFMVKGGEQMQQIILNLSEYTNIENNLSVKEPINIEDKVAIAKRHLIDKLAAKNAVVFYDELPVLNANRHQVSVLFEHLLDNAIKFSRPGVQTEILVGAEEYPAHYEFYVKDNGIGFNMDFHDRIFMLFQRLHARSQYPGAGIGLAFCKKIVEQHSGEIWAESVPGEGSTFYFTLAK